MSDKLSDVELNVIERDVLFAEGHDLPRVHFSTRSVRSLIAMARMTGQEQERIEELEKQLDRKDDLIEEIRKSFSEYGWRALALAIKAKLEAVESDISTFEQEFMA